jgi:hypothetical protein
MRREMDTIVEWMAYVQQRLHECSVGISNTEIPPEMLSIFYQAATVTAQVNLVGWGLGAALALVCLTVVLKCMGRIDWERTTGNNVALVMAGVLGLVCLLGLIVTSQSVFKDVNNPTLIVMNDIEDYLIDAVDECVYEVDYK